MEVGPLHSGPADLGAGASLPYVRCLAHGPMRYRPALGWWECPGFDGEGCDVQIVYAEDVRRGAGSGIPGVEVEAARCGYAPWKFRADSYDRSPAGNYAG